MSVPIVFITGHGDIPMAVRAIKAGAVEFLTRPFRDHELLDAIRAALQRDAAEREHDNALEILRQRYATLTDREREVLPHVVSGMLNKQVGASLGISEQTVKVHRQHIMRKLSAGSLPDLVLRSPAGHQAGHQAGRRACRRRFDGCTWRPSRRSAIWDTAADLAIALA